VFLFFTLLITFWKYRKKKHKIMPLADWSIWFVTILVTLSCKTKWQKCETDIEMLKWTSFIQRWQFTQNIIIWHYFMTKEFFAHLCKINKQNNYHHAYPSLLIACHGRFAKNILRRKSIVCDNQLGANLQFTLQIKIDLECWKYELRTEIVNSKYQKIRMFQFG